MNITLFPSLLFGGFVGGAAFLALKRAKLTDRTVMFGSVGIGLSATIAALKATTVSDVRFPSTPTRSVTTARVPTTAVEPSSTPAQEPWVRVTPNPEAKPWTEVFRIDPGEIPSTPMPPMIPMVP